MREKLTDQEKCEILELLEAGHSRTYIAETVLGRKSRRSTIYDFLKSLEEQEDQQDWEEIERNHLNTIGKNAPRVLFLDIETAPLMSYVWGLWNNNVPLNMIHSDWFILGFAVSWGDSEEVKYYDNRNAEDIEDDSSLMEKLWYYLDQADIVVGHNARKFDIKKIKARMLKHDFIPFSTVRMYDTMDMAKRNFALTSNKLEYIASLISPEDLQKSKHSEFAGFELWKELLNGNERAWDEMGDYCKQDVAVNKDIFWKLYQWDNKAPNFQIYTGEPVDLDEWENIGYHYTNNGKYIKYRHKLTGIQRRGKINLLSAEVRKSQLVNIL